MVKAADSDDDSAEIEQLLAELHSSNDAAHAKVQLHTNIMHTEESKGSPFLQASDQEEEEEEKACDAPHSDVAHAGTIFCDDDASKSASFHILRTSPSKFSSTQQCDTRHPAVDKPPSPSPPSPPSFGCSCFSLPSYKRVQKKKKNSKGEFRSSKIKAKLQQEASAVAADDDDDEWRFMSTEIGPRDVDAGGLFDVKKAEREFKRVSLKEKQLTKEAKNLLDTIASC